MRCTSPRSAQLRPLPDRSRSSAQAYGRAAPDAAPAAGAGRCGLVRPHVPALPRAVRPRLRAPAPWPQPQRHASPCSSALSPRSAAAASCCSAPERMPADPRWVAPGLAKLLPSSPRPCLLCSEHLLSLAHLQPPSCARRSAQLSGRRATSGQLGVHGRSASAHPARSSSAAWPTLLLRLRRLLAKQGRLRLIRSRRWWTTCCTEAPRSSTTMQTTRPHAQPPRRPSEGQALRWPLPQEGPAGPAPGRGGGGVRREWGGRAGRGGQGGTAAAGCTLQESLPTCRPDAGCWRAVPEHLGRACGPQGGVDRQRPPCQARRLLLRPLALRFPVTSAPGSASSFAQQRRRAHRPTLATHPCT